MQFGIQALVLFFMYFLHLEAMLNLQENNREQTKCSLDLSERSNNCLICNIQHSGVLVLLFGGPKNTHKTRVLGFTSVFEEIRSGKPFK